jgi:hypothetical protein
VTTPQFSRPGRAAPGWRAGSAAVMLTVAMAASAGIAGCSTGSSAHGSKVNDLTMTPQQAAAYADKILQDTADALSPRPRLEFSEDYSNIAGPCLSGPNASQMVVVTRSYWLRGITGHDYATVGEQVLAYWRRLEWVISGTVGIGTTEPQVTAVAPPYAFSVDLEFDSGVLSLNAASVCLWPHGHPPS